MGKPKKEFQADDDDAVFAQRAIELQGTHPSRPIRTRSANRRQRRSGFSRASRRTRVERSPGEKALAFERASTEGLVNRSEDHADR
jgi:hypothetical protein